MEVKVNFKAGGSLVGLPPQFSASGESVYVARRNHILGYCTRTGTLLGEFKGLTHRVVGFSVHYYDSCECVTACSSSGEIITWEVSTFSETLNKKLKGDVVTFHIIQSEKELKALISLRFMREVSFSVVELTTLKSQKCGLTISSNPYRVAVCGDKFFAVCQTSSLNVVSFKDHMKTHTYGIDAQHEFTCLTCHPGRELVLTGDSAGRVIVWKRLFTLRPSKVVFHWDVLPVNCVGFSTGGGHFYSGGDEAVLVRWRLDDHLNRKFLPRLPSTVSQICVSPNNTFIAICTNDNVVRIVDADFNYVSLIQHVVIGSGSGIVADPKTGALVMNGVGGCIQFYSPDDNNILYNVDVVGQHRISNTTANTQVSLIAISGNGEWMATIEDRLDLGESTECRLKLWKFELAIQNFKLNTSVDNPHEGHVHSMVFQPVANPDALKLISVGSDRKFKVWRLAEGEIQIWECLYVGFYHGFQCADAAFSREGSLVAVAFSTVVTMWLSDSCHLKYALSHPVCREVITRVAFRRSDQCDLLVSASRDRLSVWNLLSLTMMWTVSIDVSSLIADTVTTNVAVITKDNAVFLFSPMSPEPVFSSDRLVESSETICAAAFVPSQDSKDEKLQWYQRSPIFFINSKNELYCIDSEEAATERPSQMQEIDDSRCSETITQAEIDTSRAIGPVQRLYQRDVGQMNIKKYLDVAIKTMSPMKTMCGSLLRYMAARKP